MISKHAYPYFDGLRGIAALAVVFFHMDSLIGTLASPTAGYSQDSWVWQIYRRLIDGNFAVCIFFVLSGFVLLAGFKRTEDYTLLGRGAVKRYLRLTPLVFLSTMIAYLLGASGSFYSADAAALMGGHQWLQTVYAFDFHLPEALRQGVFGVYFGDYRYNSVLWTIGTELWGSVFLFGFVAIFYRSTRFNLLSVISGLLLIWQFGITGFYASLFLAGALLLFNDRFRLPGYWALAGMYLGSFNPWCPEVQFLNDFATTRAIQVTVPLDIIAHCVGAVLLVAAVPASASLRSVFTSAPAMFLGRLSFAVYVFHFAVLMSVGCAVFVAIGGHEDLKVAAGLAIISTVVVTLGLSALMYRFVDLPSQELANRFSKLFFKRVSAEV